MSEINESQKLISETTEGMVVVDAGPGTGKTHTIVERYIRLISKPDVSPKDVMLLTFTNNAAAEMDERIKKRMAELGMEKDSKLVQTSTFDAFCLSIVLDSPDQVSSFFGFKETLTRAAAMSDNRTINNDYFTRFLDGFLIQNGGHYGDIAVIASENAVSVLRLIENLMSRGLIPLRKGWFGNNWRRILEGDKTRMGELLNDFNTAESGKSSAAVESLRKLDYEIVCGLPDLDADILSQDTIEEIIEWDRSELFDFIHDVYYEYIRQSVNDNRLTFGLTAMLAFTVLYSKRSVRERNSFRYLMIDEFQDTNANQLMISLMILKEPNLCVVGDWKQGIYGFRYVSIENITEFESRAVEMRRFLNDDITRVPFLIPETIRISLDRNYRSSQLIIDTSFNAICLHGSNSDRFD